MTNARAPIKRLHDDVLGEVVLADAPSQSRQGLGQVAEDHRSRTRGRTHQPGQPPARAELEDPLAADRATKNAARCQRLGKRRRAGPDLVAEFCGCVRSAALDGDERAIDVYSTAARAPELLKINVFVVGEGRHVYGSQHSRRAAVMRAPSVQRCLPAFSSRGTAAGGQQLSSGGPAGVKTPLLQPTTLFWLTLQKSSMSISR